MVSVDKNDIPDCFFDQLLQRRNSPADPLNFRSKRLIKNKRLSKKSQQA